MWMLYQLIHYSQPAEHPCFLLQTLAAELLADFAVEHFVVALDFAVVAVAEVVVEVVLL